MNFQQLRSIREAARRGYNLTEVANALFTSQPGGEPPDSRARR
jgi:LysR family cys regulon transcriptional activator